MADLMVTARGAGKDSFGVGAMELIRAKATERVTGHSIYTPATFSMKRGTLLEYVATFLLSQYWQNVYGATWIPIGDNAGATPDFLTKAGEPGDIKCPESEAKMFGYADAIAVDEHGNSDWYALVDWDKGYAWQLATQALACGVEHAWLVYFSDKIKAHKLSEEQQEQVTYILESTGDNLLRLTGQFYEYQFGGLKDTDPGFAFVPRRFRIPSEITAQLKARIEAAEVECQAIAKRYATLMDSAPTPEEVEAVAELMEGADIETEQP
jgi:hypothetical protein